MTEKYLEWITYNQLIDHLFSSITIWTILIVIVVWLIWCSSIKALKIVLKITLAVLTIGLALAWYMEYWL